MRTSCFVAAFTTSVFFDVVTWPFGPMLIFRVCTWGVGMSVSVALSADRLPATCSPAATSAAAFAAPARLAAARPPYCSPDRTQSARVVRYSSNSPPPPAVRPGRTGPLGRLGFMPGERIHFSVDYGTPPLIYLGHLRRQDDKCRGYRRDRFDRPNPIYQRHRCGAKSFPVDCFQGPSDSSIKSSRAG